MSGPRRIPEIQARLDRWAIWVHGAMRGPSGAGSTLGRLVDMAAGRRIWPGDGYRSTVPVDNVECSVTDDAVLALPADLQQAVRAWHLADYGTLDEVAGRLGVVRATLHRRLCHADQRLSDWLRARRWRRA